MCQRTSKKAGVPCVEQTQRRQAGGQGSPITSTLTATSRRKPAGSLEQKVKLSDFVFKKALSWVGGEWIAQRQGWSGGSGSPRQ